MECYMRLFMVIFFLLLSLTLSSALLPGMPEVMEAIKQIEIYYFNQIIDNYSGGILFDIVGGASKAKQGFARNQEAVNRRDYGYFPEDLRNRKGENSERLLMEINRHAIDTRISMAEFLHDYIQTHRISVISPSVYQLVYGMWLLKRNGTAQNAIINYQKEVQKIIRFNNSLSMGLFEGTIKSKMNEVSTYTADKRVVFMRDCMRIALAEAEK
jgi:hypothetical protein